jgi:two-component system, sensor histidine kinase and response regulator
VAGNLGAKSVQSAAATLEKAIHGKAALSEVKAATQQAAAALDPLIAQLNTVLDSLSPEKPSAIPASASTSPTQSREAAVQLTRLLSEFDPGASDFIETNRATLRPLFEERAWVEFEKLVKDYSFADAQAQLDHVLAT